MEFRKLTTNENSPSLIFGDGYQKSVFFSETYRTFDRVMSAALSASIYTDNVWSIQTLSEPMSNTPPWRALTIPKNDPKQLERAALLKEIYKPVSGISLPSSGQACDPINGALTDWCFDHNVFYFGDLACATVLEREGLDGASVVELCFRGTEKSTTGHASKDRRNMIGGYFLSAYKDLGGHYERHRLLIDAVIDIVNQRQYSGEKVALHVSGHSLGGSMAELFVKKEASRLRDPEGLFACTFGSPGIGATQNAMSMLVKGCMRLILTKLGLISDDACKASTVSAVAGSQNNPENPWIQVNQYIDPNDPVPKLGILGGYAPSGNVYLSRPRDRDPFTGAVISGSMLDISWHSVAKYEKWCTTEFSQAAYRAVQLNSANKEIIKNILKKFANAHVSANTFVASTVHYLNNPGLPNQLSHHIDQILDRARTRSGMIPFSAPNSSADSTQLTTGALEAGRMILSKLEQRRNKAGIKQVEIAMASVIHLSMRRA